MSGADRLRERLAARSLASELRVCAELLTQLGPEDARRVRLALGGGIHSVLVALARQLDEASYENEGGGDRAG